MTTDIVVTTSTPIPVNFGRIYPQFKVCTFENLDNYGTLDCIGQRYTATQVIINDDVVCESRFNYDATTVAEILETCDHWLYFDCPVAVMAEKLTLTNRVDPDLDWLTALHVVEFQAGFDSSLTINQHCSEKRSALRNYAMRSFEHL